MMENVEVTRAGDPYKRYVAQPYTTRTTCRVCDSPDLVPLFSLGSQFVSNFVEKDQVHAGIRCPIELELCRRCTLVQLKHTAPQELLYTRHYWYRSGVTQTMRDALADVACAVKRQVDLRPGDVVLDIGSNDGTLLRNYPDGLLRVGIEPALNLATPENYRGLFLVRDFWHVNEVRGDEWKTANINESRVFQRAKCVTALGMFYDLEDPNQFIADVAKVLAPDGVFIAQLMCLKQMVAQGDVGNLCVKPDTLLLGDNLPIAKANRGQRVFSRSGELVDVYRRFDRSYSGEMFSIKPMYLEPITCTPEHPILIAKMTYSSARDSYYRGTGIRYKRGGPRKHDTLSTSNLSPCHPARDRRAAHTLQWVDAKDVCRGDFVVVPKLREVILPEIDLRKFTRMSSRGWRSGLTSLRITEDLAWALGLYVAEGHTGGPENNRSVWFTLSSKEMHFIRRLRKVFGAIGYKVTLINRTHINNSISGIVTCCSLARAFREWFGCRATEKRIPDFLMTAPKEIKSAFLSGLFAGDGYRRANKVHYHTASKVLALQVQLMAFSMGGMLGISYVKPYDRTIRGRPIKSKDSWQLRGSSKALAKIFGYKHSGTKVQHGFVGEDYVLLPVKQVWSEIYTGPVCNVETFDHTYLVSNAVVHNCHEHLEFYSLKSLDYLLGAHGLEVFDIEENSVNGGSYRLYCRHKGSGIGTVGPGAYMLSALKYHGIENSLRLANPYTYRDWFARLEANRDRCVDFIRREVAAGKRVWWFGASTKSAVITQWYGLDHSLIEAAVDRSEEKIGRYMVGVGIPIYSETEFRAARPNYAVVGPYAFVDEFVRRERVWLEDGGIFIVPLPQARLIAADPKDLARRAEWEPPDRLPMLKVMVL